MSMRGVKVKMIRKVNRMKAKMVPKVNRMKAKMVQKVNRMSVSDGSMRGKATEIIQLGGC